MTDEMFETPMVQGQCSPIPASKSGDGFILVPEIAGIDKFLEGGETHGIRGKVTWQDVFNKPNSANFTLIVDGKIERLGGDLININMIAHGTPPHGGANNN